MCRRTWWSADDCERSLLYPWTGWMRWGREEQMRYRIEASLKVASCCWLCWEVMTDDSENSERSCSGTASSPCPCMITARQTALRAARNHIRLRFRIILHAKLQFSADINTHWKKMYHPERVGAQSPPLWQSHFILAHTWAYLASRARTSPGLYRAQHHTAHSKSEGGLSRHAARSRWYADTPAMHGYHAGAVPTVHVGAHTRENESRRTTHLPRPSYLFPGNRPLFPLRLRLLLLPSSYGCLHRPPLQSRGMGLVYHIHSFIPISPIWEKFNSSIYKWFRLKITKFVAIVY